MKTEIKKSPSGLTLLLSGQGKQEFGDYLSLKEQASPQLWRSMGRWIPKNIRAEAIHENRIAQPLIVAMQLFQWEGIRDQLPTPDCVAGYSLGELTACILSGALSPSQGLELASLRARLMDEVYGGPAGMVAILGLDLAVITRLATQFEVHVAIRNEPRHFILAGPQENLQPLLLAAKAKGASRVVKLQVNTPSHTPFLKGASEKFQSKSMTFLKRPKSSLSFPVFSSQGGPPSRTPAQSLRKLAQQISSPLDWGACMVSIREQKPQCILELGPSNELTQISLRINPDIPARAITDFTRPEGAIRWINSILKV